MTCRNFFQKFSCLRVLPEGHSVVHDTLAIFICGLVSGQFSFRFSSFSKLEGKGGGIGMESYALVFAGTKRFIGFCELRFEGVISSMDDKATQ